MLNGIFVTGATGFVGSHFVLEWLRARPEPVAALVRGGDAGAQTRLVAALDVARQARGQADLPALDALTCVDGDVARPLCGLSQADTAPLRGTIDGFWHFASELRYEDGHRDAIFRTNVDGALHALELAQSLGVRRFVYVSTAYVCGRNEGLIEETLLPDSRAFSNAYEESKARAERELDTRCKAIGLPLTILRPSIVIGPSTTKSSRGTQTGLFSLLHSVRWIRSSQAGAAMQFRVPACAAAEVNFIPVDHVIADMLALAEDGFGTQELYHLTSAASVSVEQCWQAISAVTGLTTATLAAPGSFEPTPAERFIARRIGFFLSYITADRRFVRSLPSHDPVDAAAFTGYVRNAWQDIDRKAGG